MDQTSRLTFDKVHEVLEGLKVELDRRLIFLGPVLGCRLLDKLDPGFGMGCGRGVVVRRGRRG